MISPSELHRLYRAVSPIVQNALRTGRLFRPECTLTEPDADILAEYDVEIPLDDGTKVTANVFRSRRADEAGEQVPVVMCAHPYDNRLLPALGRTPLGGPPHQYRLIPQLGKPQFSTQTSWESPDPNFWVGSGYAVVNMNLPGFANSGGEPRLFSREHSDAFGQAIDWIGERPWCTGKVGLSGVSYLAISQYGVAAGETKRGIPKCLAAICPWEGIRDIYQEMFFEGGVEERGFPVFWWHTEVKPTINCSEEEFAAIEGHLPQEMADRHPFYDDYWKSKRPRVEDIDVPMLICASFSDQGLHTRGSFRIFRDAKTEKKWLYTHRTLKWDAFYSPEVQELTRSFFDCFVKGETGGPFPDAPPVRLEVRSARDDIHAVRHEQEWPLARTRYEKLFLTDRPELVHTAPPEAVELGYDAKRGRLQFEHVFTRDTELTGYMKLRLWVEARGGRPPADDMVLFVGVEKIDRRGNSVRFYGSVGNHADLVTRGLLAVSRRAVDEITSTEWEPILLHQEDQKLTPGEIVPVDVALNPSSTFFEAGESIRLVISPNEIVRSPPYVKANDRNRGTHVIHLGGARASYLMIPVV